MDGGVAEQWTAMKIMFLTNGFNCFRGKLTGQFRIAMVMAVISLLCANDHVAKYSAPCLC